MMLIQESLFETKSKPMLKKTQLASKTLQGTET